MKGTSNRKAMRDERLFFNLVNFIEIEISSLCNRKCTYCPSSRTTRNRELLPIDIFEKIMKELQTIDFNGGIAFHQYNEPLLEKEHLFRCIKMVTEYLPKAKMVLYTNGDLLTRKKYMMLKRAGINEFHITCQLNENEIWNKELAFNKVRKMRKLIHNVMGKYVIEDSKVSVLPLKIIEFIFKVKSYRFLNIKRYPTITFIESTDYFINGSTRLGAIQDINTNNNGIENKGSWFCPSLIHSMHISYKGNAYLCWDCCEGAKESSDYILGSVYEKSIFELYKNKESYISSYLFGEMPLICSKCYWNR